LTPATVRLIEAEELVSLLSELAASLGDIDRRVTRFKAKADSVENAWRLL
jgi:hypothetical protein